MNFTILFEDDDLIIIDKPAGVVVNRAVSAKGLTVQEWIENKLNLEEFVATTLNEEEFKARGGVVHRLDKETSGILVLAKNPTSFDNLKNQFKSREIHKTYIALTHGKVTPQEGVIDMPVGRLPWNRTRFGVLPEGREATTKYTVIEYRMLEAEILSLVELHPETGRTHQIRVHLRHLGFPIFSDELYAGRKQAKKDRKILTRHFLHSSRMVLRHPATNDEIEINCALPIELKDFLDKTTLTLL